MQRGDGTDCLHVKKLVAVERLVGIAQDMFQRREQIVVAFRGHDFLLSKIPPRVLPLCLARDAPEITKGYAGGGHLVAAIARAIKSRRGFFAISRTLHPRKDFMFG